jgi:hypothetical protein
MGQSSLVVFFVIDLQKFYSLSFPAKSGWILTITNHRGKVSVKTSASGQAGKEC